jgi:hypothetical protein
MPPVPNTNLGNMGPPPPPLPLSEPGGLEGTRYYKRVQSGSRSKGVAIARSPPRAGINEEGVQSKVVSSITKPTEATPTDEGAGGPLSPGSDCALISPSPEPLKLATTPKKRSTSSARGKALAKEGATDVENEDLVAIDVSLAILPSNKATGNNILLRNLKRAGCTTRLE